MSLLDDESVLVQSRDALVVAWFLSTKYDIFGSYSIEDDPVNPGLYIVNITGTIGVRDHSISHYTNELFRFGEVTGTFHGTGCTSLESLEGAPKKVGGEFNCSFCDGLKTIKGSPEEVGGNFYCTGCKNLRSLEGAPQEIGGYFDCSGCKNLRSLEGAPKIVKNIINITGCTVLKSFKGAPEKIGKCIIADRCCNIQSFEGLPEGGTYSIMVTNTPILESTDEYKEGKYKNHIILDSERWV